MLAKSTEYAIRALVFIQIKNLDKKRPGVIEIANEIEAPEAYTAKILQTLTRHKLVGSMKGRGGGFFFEEDAIDLTLYKVIMVMEGEACFTRCGFGLKNCNNINPCPLHEKYIAVRDEFLNIVKTENISSLANKIIKGDAVLNRKQY